MLAAQEGHLEITRLLVDKGAKVNVTEDDGWTALMLAELAGWREIVHLLQASSTADDSLPPTA